MKSVVVCGSQRFKDEIRQFVDDLKKLGVHVVFEPNFEGQSTDFAKKEEKEQIKEQVEELVGTKGALFFNEELKVIKKIPVGILQNIRVDEPPYIVAIDGVATPRIIEACERMGCSNLIATTFVHADTDVNLVSM